MDNSQKSLTDFARERMELGDFRAAYDALIPLLNAGDGEAQFLYSTFSVSESETDAEFEARSLALLESAAKAGYVPAIYALAVCFDIGDIVERDSCKAAELYERAASLGDFRAKFFAGLNFYFGSNGVNLNRERGLSLIEESARSGFDVAMDFMSDRDKGE